MAIGLVGLLLVVFLIQLVRELRMFATLKSSGNTKHANELFFHSFVGSIIYGHGELKGVTPAINLVVGVLSDTLFMVVCEKLLLLVTCTEPTDAVGGVSYLQINPSIECWTSSEHQLLAVLCLIGFGFYLPLSAMIAPMLMEADAEAAEAAAAKEKKKKAAAEKAAKAAAKNGAGGKPVPPAPPKPGQPALTEAEIAAKEAADELASKKDVVMVKPFLSIITVSKCLMIVLATYFGRNGVEATILSQLFIMLALAVITMRWSVLTHAEFELGRVGLAEPCLPPAVNVWRVYIFIGGAAGALCAAIAYHFKDSFGGSKADNRMALLWCVMAATAVPFVLWYRRWESDNTKMWDAAPAPVIVELPLVKFERGTGSGSGSGGDDSKIGVSQPLLPAQMGPNPPALDTASVRLNSDGRLEYVPAAILAYSVVTNVPSEPLALAAVPVQLVAAEDQPLPVLYTSNISLAPQPALEMTFLTPAVTVGSVAQPIGQIAMASTAAPAPVSTVTQLSVNPGRMSVAASTGPVLRPSVAYVSGGVPQSYATPPSVLQSD